MEKIQNNRIDWISKAKGWAILGVVAVHVVFKFKIGCFSEIAYAGQYGVQLFFIISAFLTLKSLEEKKEIVNLKTYKKYLLHKITRLMPVLYITCFWHLLTYCFEIHGIPSVRDTIWRKGFFAVTFLNGLSFNYYNPWGAWYVGDLVIFLALAPFIKKKINTIRKSVLLFLVSVFVEYTSSVILNKFEIDTWGYFYYWLPRQFPSLSIGIFFYYLSIEKNSHEKRNSLYLFSFLVSFGFLLSKCFVSILENHVQYGILLLIYSYTLFNRKLKILNWLDVLGDNSYGIYLFHLCLLPWVSNLISRIGVGSSFLCFFMCYVIVVVLSLFCSVVVKRFVEMPFLNFVKKKFDI